MLLPQTIFCAFAHRRFKGSNIKIVMKTYLVRRCGRFAGAVSKVRARQTAEYLSRKGLKTMRDDFSNRGHRVHESYDVFRDFPRQQMYKCLRAKRSNSRSKTSKLVRRIPFTGKRKITAHVFFSCTSSETQTEGDLFLSVIRVERDLLGRKAHFNLSYFLFVK